MMKELESVIEIITLSVEELAASYGWLIVGLALLCVVTFFIEFRYVVNYFKALRGTRRKARGEGAMPLDEKGKLISIIIPMYGVDTRFINEHLPRLTAQKDVSFEIIVVYVGDSSDYFEDLDRLSLATPNLYFTKIEQKNSRFPISVKSALNIGIKRAVGKYVIFSTTEAEPASDMWLASFAEEFKRSDIVLGYSSIANTPTFGNQFARSYRLWQSIEWLSSAQRGRCYRGINSNIGFKRELYFNVNGFNHLKINIGEDDLFIQSITTADNTGVALSSKAMITERVHGGMAWFVDRYKYQNSTIRLYPLWAKLYMRTERWARLFFLGSAAALAVLLPWEVGQFALYLVGFRWILQMLLVALVSGKVGEKGLVLTTPLYDILSLPFFILMGFRMLEKDKRVWK